LPGLPHQGGVTLTAGAAILPGVATRPRTINEICACPREQGMARVELAMRVAVMQRAGISRGEIAARLDVPMREVREAVEALQAIAPFIELGERPGDDTGELTL
jgi:hypothetical protein